jgi:hypothetical protein
MSVMPRLRVIDNREIDVRVPEGPRGVSLLYKVQPPMVELHRHSPICLHDVVLNEANG